MKTNLAAVIIFVAIFGFCGCTKEKDTTVEGIFYKETSPPKQTIESTISVMENNVPDKIRPAYRNIKRPVKRTRKQSVKELKKLAVYDNVIKDIYDNRRYYSDNMLEALVNNPEMEDFVYGYLDYGMNDSGKHGLTDDEKKEKFPLFIQWDERWGYEPYGDDSNIGLAGCGPTCVSMVLYYLTGNENLTPDRVARYSMKNGYYMNGTGTAWALMDDMPALYNINVSKPELSESVMKRNLDNGNVIICAMRPGDFTVSGHFIVIYGYDKDGFMVNDPNCIARSKKRWTYGEISCQIKSIWSYSA